MNYQKRINEVGCIPIGLLFPDGRFTKEEADLCDAFVISGGVDVESVGINLVHYAIKNNKPLLGICLGAQTLAGYDWVINHLGEQATYEDIDNFYKYEYEKNYLEEVSNHDKVEPFVIDDIEQSKHDVLIVDKDSNFYKIFSKDIVKMPSLHNYMIKKDLVLNHFNVVGKSLDDVIEIIEYKGNNFIIGVQFHPELEEENLKLFEALKSNIKNE